MIYRAIKQIIDLITQDGASLLTTYFVIISTIIVLSLVGYGIYSGVESQKRENIILEYKIKNNIYEEPKYYLDSLGEKRYTSNKRLVPDDE